MEIVEQEQDDCYSQPLYGGGVGGSCASPEKWRGGSDMPDFEPTDMTSENLQTTMTPLDPEDYFYNIGEKCAHAAMGVDILVVSSTDDDHEINTQHFGLPLLRGLADRSGAPGPLLFSATNSLQSLKQEVVARAPWQSGVAFGTQLRLRISPGFEIDSSPVERLDKDVLQLAPFLATGGLMGPGVAMKKEKELWLMGSCDQFTSVSIDLQVQKKVKDRYHVSGFGEVALKPVLQTCVAFTTVETDDNGNSYTVRKLRISSLALPLAYDTESLYDSLDPEALAVILFHKLSLSALQDGLVDTQAIGESWLKSLLICLYRSAEVQQRYRDSLLSQGVDVEQHSTFVGTGRLLDQAGDLSLEDVLLGKGQEQAAILPFLIFALLQCDALRPTCGSSRPSMDSRCAAMTQMASMTPSALSRCIAPILQHWSTEEDEPVLEMVDLNQDAMQHALYDCRDGDVLFLDSPQQILVYDSRHARDPNTTTKQSIIQLSPKLQAAVETSAQSNRTPPTIRYVLKDPPTEEARKEAALCLEDCLIEDKPTTTGHANFANWKAAIALCVQA
jgi:hypothetical protein